MHGKIHTTIHDSHRGLLVPLVDVDMCELELHWRELEACADGSFFLSWSWIGAWLELVSAQADLYLYKRYQQGVLLGLAVISLSSIKRRKLFRSTTLALNEMNQSEFDMFIEYNGVLARRGFEAQVLNDFVADMQQLAPDWEEIRLTNIPRKDFNSLELKSQTLTPLQDNELTAWIAPLDHSTSLDSLLAGMSKNRRWQIRRSFKEYEKEGELSIHAAATLEEAHRFFFNMGELHTKRWNLRGKPGTFANPEWVKFHLLLLNTAFARGEIQLLRVRCGEKDIGYVYNFLWRKSVLMLQSGFAMENSNLLRPGFISHMLAMQFNAKLGASEYDFMVGDASYKNILASTKVTLVSARLQRRNLKFTLENALVRVYRYLRPQEFFHGARKASQKLFAAATFYLYPFYVSYPPIEYFVV